MTDAYNDKLHVMGIKERCNPAKLTEQTMSVLEGLVQVCSNVHNPATLPALTRKLVSEAYEELSGRGIDDRCYDDDRTFLRSLTTQVEMRARDYKDHLNELRAQRKKDQEPPQGGPHETPPDQPFIR